MTPNHEYTITIPETATIEEALTAATDQLRAAGAPEGIPAHFSFRLGYHYSDYATSDPRRIRPAVSWAAHDAGIGVNWL